MSTILHFRHTTDRRHKVVEKTDRPSASWMLDELVQAKPAAWLNSTIRSASYASVALSLWTHHPNLRLATERLGNYLTPLWPSSAGGSLLGKTIEKAVAEVDIAVQRGASYEARIVGIYLFWLASCVDDVARLQISGTTPTGEVITWKYFSEPLHQWAARHGMQQLEARLVAEPTSKEALAGLRTHLLAHIADPLDVGYLEIHAPRG